MTVVDPHDELAALAEAVMEGELTDADRARLVELLRDDELAQQRYLDMLSMHTVLRHVLTAPEAKQANAMDVLAHIADWQRDQSLALPEREKSSSSGSISVAGPRRVRWPRWVASILIVASLAGVLMVAVKPSAPLPPQPVAILTDARHAVWEDEKGRLVFNKKGKTLVPQTLRLAEGIASITFNDGAVVMLDARDHRTHFELNTNSSSFLHVGKIVAKAEPEKSKGFTVHLPGNRRVIDIGTEFGILVDVNGLSEVQVLSGSVEAVRQDDAGNVLEKSTLTNSEGAQLGEGDSAFKATEISTTEFERAFDSLFAKAEKPKPAISDPTSKPNTATGPLIKSVRSNSSHPYRIVANGLREDAKGFTDREYEWNGTTVKGMPSYLIGADLVLTSMADKENGSLKVDLELRDQTTLYVFLSDRGPAPDWLQRDFEKIGDRIAVDESGINDLSRPNSRDLGVGAGVSVDLPYSIWKRRDAAGGVVHLGAVKKLPGKKTAMYGIAAVPAVREK